MFGLANIMTGVHQDELIEKKLGDKSETGGMFDWTFSAIEIEVLFVRWPSKVGMFNSD